MARTAACMSSRSFTVSLVAFLSSESIPGRSSLSKARLTPSAFAASLIPSDIQDLASEMLFAKKEPALAPIPAKKPTTADFILVRLKNDSFTASALGLSCSIASLVFASSASRRAYSWGCNDFTVLSNSLRSCLACFESWAYDLSALFRRLSSRRSFSPFSEMVRLLALSCAFSSLYSLLWSFPCMASFSMENFRRTFSALSSLVLLRTFSISFCNPSALTESVQVI